MPDAATAPPTAMRTFGHLLVNTAVANLTTNYLWWALTFWAYLETRSVLATGLIGGAYMLAVSFSSIFFGSFVDHHRKLAVMRASTVFSLVAFALAAGVFVAVPEATLLDLGAPWFWVFAGIILIGAVVEHMRNIALSTSVTILVPDEQRARANGLVGTVQGVSFIATSVVSGLSVGLLGMGGTLVVVLALLVLTIAHLLVVRFPGDRVAAASDETGRAAIDLRGSIAVVRAAQGLFALIVFATFNNLIGGIYMALMDPYGLEMFSVEVWGLLLALASTGFIVGGAVVASRGLGRNPMRTMLLVVVVMGVVAGTFTIREWPVLYIGGMFVYMCLVPVVEAAEQTVLQRVVPFERQGRVFGLAMALESAAAPVSAFLVAPLAELWIIPYARSDAGREALRPLLGDGESRGIALVFLVGGLLMVLVALLGLRSRVYRTISRTYREAAPQGPGAGAATDDRPAPHGDATLGDATVGAASGGAALDPADERGGRAAVEESALPKDGP